jgi:tripartite-type tricarboxylate transporter receptor subunit TctC
MTTMSKRRACMLMASWALASQAGAFGDKPLKLVVPAPAGGTMDIVARLLGQQLASDTGQTVIVENRAGAGGGIGMQAMLQAPADGNTLLVGASNLLAEIPHVIKQPFDPLKDVLPLATVARSGIVLVAPAGNPARDFKALVAQLEKNKGKASYATYSPGTVSHYAAAILDEQLKLDMQHIPFAGSPPALQNLLGGQVDIMFDGMLTSMPMIKAGKLRPYAYTGAQRSRHLPDVPTMAELGYPQVQFVGWVGVMGSAKLAPADVAKIQAALKKAASVPAIQQRIFETGLEPEVNADSAALLRETREISDRNAAIVKKFGIKL